MAKIDPFTVKRIIKFVGDHRHATGQLPTLQDFEKAGISRETVDDAVRQGVLTQQYINLTSGPMVKGYVVEVE